MDNEMTWEDKQDWQDYQQWLAEQQGAAEREVAAEFHAFDCGCPECCPADESVYTIEQLTLFDAAEEAQNDHFNDWVYWNRNE